MRFTHHGISVEIFHHPTDHPLVLENGMHLAPGWYWTDPVGGIIVTEDCVGPYQTRAGAEEDARQAIASLLEIQL